MEKREVEAPQYWLTVSEAAGRLSLPDTFLSHAENKSIHKERIFHVFKNGERNANSEQIS